MKKVMWVILIAAYVCGGDFYYYNEGKKVNLTPLDQGVQTYATVPADKGDVLRFRNEKGQILTINDELIVKFKNGKNIQNYLNEYGLVLLKKYSLSDMYLLRAPSPEMALQAANSLNEKPDVEFAQPNIARQRHLR